MTAGTRSGEFGLAALVSSGFVLATGAVTLSLIDLGPLSGQMALHLFVMNIAAPLLAVLFAPRLAAGRYPGGIWVAAATQIVLLWAWHLPPVQSAMAASAGLNLAMLALLAAASFMFWALVLVAASEGRWRALASLMLTGKLVCLMGALMIFATRDLYLLPGLALPFCSTGPSSLDDQHFAGLLMITACPLSYLVAGVVIAVQMFVRLEKTERLTLAAG